MLEGLKLKELNELLAGTIEKPLGRKAKAVEAALALPDLQDRLAARISFREMFEVVPPQGLDVAKLVESFGYATAVATVVEQTYYTAITTLDVLDEVQQGDSSYYNAWSVTNWEEPLPACAVSVCKKYKNLPSKKPPYHIGCTCRLVRSFNE